MTSRLFFFALWVDLQESNISFFFSNNKAQIPFEILVFHQVKIRTNISVASIYHSATVSLVARFRNM